MVYVCKNICERLGLKRNRQIFMLMRLGKVGYCKECERYFPMEYGRFCVCCGSTLRRKIRQKYRFQYLY